MSRSPGFAPFLRSLRIRIDSYPQTHRVLKDTTGSTVRDGFEYDRVIFLAAETEPNNRFCVLKQFPSLLGGPHALRITGSWSGCHGRDDLGIHHMRKINDTFPFLSR